MPTLSVYSNGKSWEQLERVLEGERTLGVTVQMPEEQFAGSFVADWDARIGVLLNEVLQKWLKVLRQEQAAWPFVEDFEYEPEEVSTTSISKVAAVRRAKYAVPEIFAAYTAEELEQFF
jgi:hypothetical protein